MIVAFKLQEIDLKSKSEIHLFHVIVASRIHKIEVTIKQDHCHGIISRRALQGKKYLLQDIHNFSFSAKIQDGRQKW